MEGLFLGIDCGTQGTKALVHPAFDIGAEQHQQAAYQCQGNL
jgi:sugar (pentulose or hexulose) kinase